MSGDFLHRKNRALKAVCCLRFSRHSALLGDFTAKNPKSQCKCYILFCQYLLNKKPPKNRIISCIFLLNRVFARLRGFFPAGKEPFAPVFGVTQKDRRLPLRSHYFDCLLCGLCALSNGQPTVTSLIAESAPFTVTQKRLPSLL